MELSPQCITCKTAFSVAPVRRQPRKPWRHPHLFSSRLTVSFGFFGEFVILRIGRTVKRGFIYAAPNHGNILVADDLSAINDQQNVKADNGQQQ